MTIAAGASTSTIASTTSPAITTQVSGSLFFLAIHSNAGTAPVITVSDVMGNTPYLRIGSQIHNANSGNWIDLFYFANGVGGSGHTFAFGNSGGAIASQFFAALEVTGAALTAALDQINNHNTGFVSGNQTSGNVTVTPPANGELLVSGITTDVATAPVFTEANSFSILRTNTGGLNLAGALGAKVVTSPGTYNASWSDGQTSDKELYIVSFLGAPSVAAAAGPVPRCKYILP